jgi:hypothetical protein
VKSDKEHRQTCPPYLYCLILLAGAVAFIVIFIVFNDNFFYLITIFVVLLTGAEAPDKAPSGTRHLPNQGATASREG